MIKRFWPVKLLLAFLLVMETGIYLIVGEEINMKQINKQRVSKRLTVVCVTGGYYRDREAEALTGFTLENEIL